MNNEQDILRRAQQGDSEAFRLLVEAYQTQVYRLALRMCGEAAAGPAAAVYAGAGLCRDRRGAGDQ